MTVVIFLLVLAVLVFVHELGHFLAAKTSDIRVDEFSVGFPPRIFTHQPVGDETTYSIGALLLGGYVKIHGEDYETGGDDPRSFVNQSHLTQAKVLVAGVFFNALFAWLLLSIAFVVGIPTAVSNFSQAQDLHAPEFMVTTVLPDSPADRAGLETGAEIVELRSDSSVLSDKELSVKGAQNLINESEEVIFVIAEEGEREEIVITPEEGIVAGSRATGIALSWVGTARSPVYKAPVDGLERTVSLTGAMVVGVGDLLSGLLSGGTSLDQVAGPVGIAGLAGDAFDMGFVYLLTFSAFISLNLAVLNLLPIPALDGGRLLFILIEKIKGSPLRGKGAQIANLIGFGLLLLLMLIVTANDIIKLF